MELREPYYVAIQPYNRNPQFYTLSEWRMKDILDNHYKTIEKHSKKIEIETIYSLGMAREENIQIIRFNPEDIILFHEFNNDISKINAPFMQLKETVIGIVGVKNYPQIFGVRSLDEIHPDIRAKFEKKGKNYVTKAEITLEDMEKEEKHLHQKGFAGSVWEYPIDKYGWEAFSEVTETKKRLFNKQKRLTSIIYFSHSGAWWGLSDHDRAQKMVRQKVLLKKYDKYVDSGTVQLLGFSEPQFANIFEYPFENVPIYNQLISDTLKIHSPFLEIEQVFTGLSGIGDYWLEQLKDVSIKKVPMSKVSRSRWGFKA